jgi:hypothetical protein
MFDQLLLVSASVVVEPLVAVPLENAPDIVMNPDE